MTDAKHIAKLRRKTRRFASWRTLGSQAVQDVIERHERVYARFFKRQSGLLRFKKVKKYRSFTLKQAGWKLGEETPGQRHRKIKIGQTTYKFVYHRPLTGDIKTVTIKRDAAGRLWVCFSVVEQMSSQEENETTTGHIGGFDFGLRTFLTTDEGHTIAAPSFFRDDLPRLRRI
jgi:putative transposase